MVDARAAEEPRPTRSSSSAPPTSWARFVSALRSRATWTALVVVQQDTGQASVRRLLDLGVDAVVDEAEAA